MLTQMVDAFNALSFGAVIGVERPCARGYRLVRHPRRRASGTTRSSSCRGWSRSRSPALAPSNLGVVGRYVLIRASSSISSTPKRRRRRRNPAHRRDRSRCSRDEQVLAYRFDGTAFRLRQQARLSEGDARVRAAPSRSGDAIRSVSARAFQCARRGRQGRGSGRQRRQLRRPVRHARVRWPT